jgi:ribonucleotide monophosphatase NagD (HAD superfamily)
VFNDPRDWALSLQVIVDTLLSDNGHVGTRPNPEPVMNHVPLYFSNTDLLWANEHPHPRLGQGGFYRALWGLYTGFARQWYKTPPYKPTNIGKPGTIAFRLAETMLYKNMTGRDATELEFGDWPVGVVTTDIEALGRAFSGEGRYAYEEGKEFDGEDKEVDGEGKEEGEDANAGDKEASGEGKEASEEGKEASEEGKEASEEGKEAGTGALKKPSTEQNILKRVYMIGDNPRSDIMGANIFKSTRGVEWVSILVKSGVFKDGTGHGAPRAMVDDVLAAVDWAMENERRIENGEPLEEGPYHRSATHRAASPRRPKKRIIQTKGRLPRTFRTARDPKEPKEPKGPKEPRGPKEFKGPKKARPEKKEMAKEEKADSD